MEIQLMARNNIIDIQFEEIFGGLPEPENPPSHETDKVTKQQREAISAALGDDAQEFMTDEELDADLAEYDQAASVLAAMINLEIMRKAAELAEKARQEAEEARKKQEALKPVEEAYQESIRRGGHRPPRRKKVQPAAA